MRNRPARRRGRLGAPLATLLAGFLLAGTAWAQTVVYHSPGDDGVNPGTSHELPVGPWESLFLWLDAGSQESSSGTVACSDGDGRELCGYEILITAVGTATFVDFVPEEGVVYRITPSELEANGLFATSPALGPIRVGELKVSVSDTAGEVMLEAGQTILAGLQSEDVPQTVMAAAAPEPGRFALLAAGGALLALLARRRGPSLGASRSGRHR